MRQIVVAERTSRAVWGLIERWGLHADVPACLPVPVERVAHLEGWRVAWGQLYPVMGYAIVAPGYRLIRVDERMSEPWQRLTIAHELGHVLAGHHGRPVDAPAGGQQHQCALEAAGQHDELEATLLGAALLVPRAVLELGWGAWEIAHRCGLPIGVAEALLDRWLPERAARQPVAV